MSILIGGDLVPTVSNEKFFKNAEMKQILCDGLYDFWLNSTYRIFNLECPIANYDSPIKKFGPNLRCNVDVINGIKEIAPSVICLANNHIMDQGSIGYFNTIRCLDEHKINYIGVGNDVNSLKKSFVLNENNKHVGIYNFCENEFSSATLTNCGANSYDELETLTEIKLLKNDVDYLIVIFHGGKEEYRYPTPKQQKLCRKIIDNGADVVICQHSHCIGCDEKYNKGIIVYGQGNFIFDYKDNDYWNSSLIIDIDFNNGLNINYVPIVKEKFMVRLATKNEKEKIMNDFYFRSNEIKNERFVVDEYEKYCSEKLFEYINSFHGHRLLTRILNKLGLKRLSLNIYKQSDLLKIFNYINCETHRELLINVLKMKIYGGSNEKK